MKVEKEEAIAGAAGAGIEQLVLEQEWKMV